MCGIVAMFSRTGSVHPEPLERATRALDHRGPDDRQQWIDSARTVGLGHTRLSIIDLSGGRQPVANEDGSIRAVVNGELYDFERIRGELIARGHHFRSNSDSELVVHLYEEYGTACVEHMRGEVAFVLYDANRDVLLAARDRFGIKPLVYAEHDGVLIFASEAKALFAAGVPAVWDRESVIQATLLGGPLEDRTFFAGVRQLPAGHILLATRRSERLVRYWDFDYPRADERPSPASVDEDRDQLAAVLDDAVRLRLRADVPVACYLSGGIDSCAVLGLAARRASTPIRAFTLAFDHAAYDEDAIAREMAARANAEYTPIPVTQDGLAADFEDALYFAERPLNNANSVAKFQLSRAVRAAGIKVVLTGEGSDEIFAGYPHYRRDLALAGADRARAEQRLAELAQTNAVSRGMLLPDGDGLSVASVRAALDGFAPTWVEAFATVGEKVKGLLHGDFANAVVRRDPLALFVGGLETSRQLRGRHPVHQSMYLWSKSVLPNFILSVLGDRMEMAHSVEGRVPFLDHRVVELSTRLPIDRLIRGNIEKYLLREVARPVVTDTVYRREKHPFFAPPAAASDTGRMRELLHDTLRGPLLADSPFFDARAVTAVLDSLPRRDVATRTAFDGPLMVMASYCLLQRRLGITDVA